ncbi:MAG: hypothetical protein OQK12_02755, partial [Motiliproteus sp.]|nr:hypothetical protein [Motiliproteus sp.]
EDRATQVCPVGALMVKQQGFRIPIGQRIYDQGTIDDLGNRRPQYHSPKSKTARIAGDSDD